MNRQRYEVRAVALSGLLLALGGGCDKSSEGTQPAASASAVASAAPAPSASASAQPVAANDQAGSPDDYDDTDPSALTDFHQTLDSSGSWTDDPKVGTVWIPAPGVVGATFVPYQTGGHWVYGDDYTWVSDYDWGWAPFHYGRWTFIEGTGWGWIPGRVYAPAWVSWRVGAPGFAYVGWAPLAPTWGWRAGVAVNIGFPAPRWSYCPTAEVFSPKVSAHVVVGAKVSVAENGTKPYGSEGTTTPATNPGSTPPKGSGSHASGPPPKSIGIDPTKVPHVPPADPGLQHAQGFSKPATATALGAHPPSSTVGGKESPGAIPGKTSPSNAKTPTEPANTNTKVPPNTLHAPVPANEPKEAPKGKPGGGKKEK